MEAGQQAGTGLGVDYWKFWTGQTISNVGNAVSLFALPLLVYELTGSAISLALTTASEFVPYLLFGLVIGAWVDRLDRKRMMIAVDILRAVFIGAIPLLAASDALSVWWIYAIAFINSTLNIFFDAGQYAAIPNMVGRDDLVSANGRIQASYSGAQILGPILAGALAAVMSIANVLVIDAASFIASAVSLWIVRASFNPTEPPESTSIFKDIGEGLRFVLGHPVLRTISVMMALYNFVATTVVTQLFLFADVRLDATRPQIGILYAAGSAGILSTSLLSGWFRKRWSFSTVALGALTIDGLMMLIFSRVTEFWLAVPVYGLALGFGLLFNIQTISLRQMIVPNRLLGRVMSIAGVLAWSAIPLGAYVGGILIEATGDVALVYSGIGVITIAIPLAFSFSPMGKADRYIPQQKEQEGSNAFHEP